MTQITKKKKKKKTEKQNNNKIQNNYISLVIFTYKRYKTNILGVVPQFVATRIHTVHISQIQRKNV